MALELKPTPERRTTVQNLVIVPAAGTQSAREMNLTYSWDRLRNATLLQLLEATPTNAAEVWRVKMACLGDVVVNWNLKDKADGAIDPDAVVIEELPAVVIQAMFDAIKPAAGGTGYMAAVAAFFA